MHLLKLYLQVLFEVSALLFYQFKLRLELPRRRRLKLCLRTAVILVEIHGIVGMMMCANGAKAHAKIAIVSFAAKRVESPATHTWDGWDVFNCRVHLIFLNGWRGALAINLLLRGVKVSTV
jgi:hypothetical protein